MSSLQILQKREEKCRREGSDFAKERSGPEENNINTMHIMRVKRGESISINRTTLVVMGGELSLIFSHSHTKSSETGGGGCVCERSRRSSASPRLHHRGNACHETGTKYEVKRSRIDGDRWMRVCVWTTARSTTDRGDERVLPRPLRGLGRAHCYVPRLQDG